MTDFSKLIWIGW